MQKMFKESSLVTSAIFKRFHSKMESVIEKNQSVKHNTLVSEIKSLCTVDLSSADDPSSSNSSSKKELSAMKKWWSKMNSKLKTPVDPVTDIELFFDPVIESTNRKFAMDLCDTYTMDQVPHNHAESRMLNEPLSIGSNDVIICRLGLKIREYHSCLMRTFIINATEEQKSHYELLTHLYRSVMKMISKCADNAIYPAQIYEECTKEISQWASKKRSLSVSQSASLKKAFVGCVGWPLSCGSFEPRSDEHSKNLHWLMNGSSSSMVSESGGSPSKTMSALSISPSERGFAMIKPGMVIHLQIGFKGLKCSDGGSNNSSKQPYSMVMGDTMIIPDGESESGSGFLTKFKRSLILYELADDANDDEKDSSKSSTSPKRKNTKSKKSSSDEKKRTGGSSSSSSSSASSSNEKRKRKPDVSPVKRGTKRKRPMSDESGDSGSDSEVEDRHSDRRGDEWKPAEGKRYLTRGSNLARQKEMEQQSRDRQKREKKQDRLRLKNQEFLLKQLDETGGDFGTKALKQKWRDPHCYDEPSELPSVARATRVMVDMKEECVLCPIFDQIVPFHVSLLKNTAVMQSGEWTHFRMNFLCPVPLPKTGREVKQPLVAQQYPQAQYIKELNFRSRDGAGLIAANKSIREIQKRVKDLAKQRESISMGSLSSSVSSSGGKNGKNGGEKREVILESHKLKLKKNAGTRVLQLQQLTLKPSFGGRKKDTGRLECHMNGLRYTDHKRNEMRILFDHIRFAFFQPSKNTPSVYIHFVLNQAIMIGKKATYDITFSRDVMDKYEDIGRMGSSAHGAYDGIRAEQEEKRRISLVNRSFKDFCKKMEEICAKSSNGSSHGSHGSSSDTGEILFDVPEMKEKYCFLGVPNKDRICLHPTSNCLVALDDSPPFVLCLRDVQLAYFERVQFHLRDFDLVFVLKDMSKEVIKISIIPRNKLNMIQDLLNEQDIMYYTGKQSMDWKEVMKGVRSNFQSFVDEGGWDFLAEADEDYIERHSAQRDAERANTNKKKNSSSMAAAAEESSEEWQPSDEDYDEDEYSDGDERYSSEEGSDSREESEYSSDMSDGEDGYSQESSFEEGMDWDEMEKKAAEEDRRRAQKDRDRDIKIRGGLSSNTKRRRRY